MVIFCLHHEFPGLCKCVKQRNPFRVMDIAGTTSTRTTFMWNLQIHFSIWLNEKIQKPTIGIKYCQCLQPPLVYCQAGKAGKATGDCSSGIANASNWCRKVYFFKLGLCSRKDIFLAMFALQPHCWGSLFALPQRRHPIANEPKDPLPRDVAHKAKGTRKNLPEIMAFFKK